MQRQVTIKDLMDRYSKIKKTDQDDYNEQAMREFVDEHKLDEITIPPRITNVIVKLLDNTAMTAQDFGALWSELNGMTGSEKNAYLHDFIIGFLRATSIAIAKNQAFIEASATIENAVNSQISIPKDKNHSPEYITFLNIYLLTREPLNVIYKANKHTSSFPVMSYEYSTVNDSMIMGVNALKLVGKMPNTGSYCNIDLSKPLYPRLADRFSKKRFDSPDENQNFNKKGMKEADLYWPYKEVKKIFKGDTGDTTYKATDGKKILYVRGTKQYQPNGVLASKIATLVNPRYFSSERALTKGMSASKQLDTYVVSFAEIDKDADLRNKLHELKTQNKMITGTGMVDEVTNFVQEGDRNIENMGLSHRDFSIAHVVKIDWNNCGTRSPITMEEYVGNKAFNMSVESLYGKNAAKVTQLREYIEERLTARLKLAMLPQELIKELANKAYADDDTKNRDKSVTELTNRTLLASQALLDQTNIPHLTTMLRNNPLLLNQITAETKKYINDHFDEPLRTKILKAYDEKSQALCNKILQECKVQVQITLDATNPVHAQYANEFVLKLQETLREISRIQNKSSTLKESINLIEKTLTEHAGNPIQALNILHDKMSIPKKTSFPSFFTHSDPINMNLVQAFKNINPPHQADSKNIKEQKVVIGAFQDSKSNSFLDKAQSEALRKHEKGYSSNPPSQRF